ncbi:MAG: 1-deoxy-D-xylulose-5-phosphate synthase, partial [Nitrospirae bacterium]
EALRHPESCFSHFGLECVGPVDGHDLGALLDLFRAARDCERPLLLHCKTEKGRGFAFSASDPTTFHSPPPFVVRGGGAAVRKGGRSFTAAFSDALGALMERDPEVVAVTAAMPHGTGLAPLAERFPERVFDTGICEGHAMDMCAGMAKAGLKPFFAVYSTFAQRALDQAFQEVALQGLPVRVCMDRAGFVGGDGAVHHGFMDIALFRPLVGSVCLAASDEVNLAAALDFLHRHTAGPTFLRYPRGPVAEPPLEGEVPPYELGRAHLVRPAAAGPRVAILALGPLVYEAAAALEGLGRDDVALYDARFAKPVDVELLARLTRTGCAILTLEDHSRAGGFGAAVLEACNDHGLPAGRIRRLAMPERWIPQGSRAGQLAEAGLDREAIAAAVEELVDAAPRVRIRGGLPGQPAAAGRRSR